MALREVLIDEVAAKKFLEVNIEPKKFFDGVSKEELHEVVAELASQQYQVLYLVQTLPDGRNRTSKVLCRKEVTFRELHIKRSSIKLPSNYKEKKTDD